MKRLFVTLYLKLIIAVGISFVITWASFSAINKQREVRYWQNQMSGVSHLMFEGATRHQGSTRDAWLTIAFRLIGLSYELTNESPKNLKQLKIEKNKQSEQFTGKVKLENQTLIFEFSNITKDFMEGVNKLIANELGRRSVSEHQEYISSLKKQFNYPVKIVNTNSIALTNFEKRQLSAGLIVYRFEDGFSAISSYGQPNKLIKSGAIKAFNPFSTGVIIFSGILLFSLTLILSLILIRPLERRFTVFSNQVDKIKLNQKNIFNSVNIKQEGNDELAKLSENVDEMAKRIIEFAHDQQQMTRSVSHEIRSPLVKMNYRLARIDTQEMSSSQQKNIEGLKNNIGELDELVNELLLYSSLDRLPSPDLVDVNISEFINEQINKLIHLNEVNIQLKDANTSDVVLSFPNYLGRILQNLLTNAQRYAKDQILISYKIESNRFVLIVEDDGPGISPELTKKIFEPFVVDDQSRNSALNGHGLGLSIVSKMAELLNGEVEISKSEQLAGAKFVLTFMC